MDDLSGDAAWGEKKPRVTPRSFEPICVSPRSFRVRETDRPPIASAFGNEQGNEVGTKDTTAATAEEDEKSPLTQLLDSATQAKFSLAAEKCELSSGLAWLS